jgi:hypothetical protein
MWHAMQVIGHDFSSTMLAWHCLFAQTTLLLLLLCTALNKYKCTCSVDNLLVQQVVTRGSAMPQPPCAKTQVQHAPPLALSQLYAATAAAKVCLL